MLRKTFLYRYLVRPIQIQDQTVFINAYKDLKRNSIIISEKDLNISYQKQIAMLWAKCVDLYTYTTLFV